MPDQNESNGARKHRVTTKSPTGEFILESSGEVVVTHLPSPPKGPPEKKIHPRRPLPPVPDARPPKAESEKEE